MNESFKYRVAATGHRPGKLGGFGSEADAKLAIFARHFVALNKPTIEHLIVGGALGWDMAIAEACTAEGVPYVLCIPFAGHDVKWSNALRNRQARVVANAAEIVIVSPGGFSETKMQIRNEYMVDRCNFVWALWDGSVSGTKNCVRYAEKKLKPIVNFWPYWNHTLTLPMPLKWD